MIKAGAASLAGIVLLPLLLFLGVMDTGDGGEASGASAEALADIPPNLLDAYQTAAVTCPGLDWTVLAAIGKVESDHGRSPLPGVIAGENSSGAGGPMQFLAATWAAYGVDGDGDGTIDRYSPVDAIYGAANYLCANGGGDPSTLERAIYAYNHADWYVLLVLDQAARYGVPALPMGFGRPAPAGETMVVASPVGPIALVRIPAVGWVNAAIAGDVDALVQDAAAAGVRLGGSAWRSSSIQIDLRRAHCGPTPYDVYQKPSSQCSPPTARPGLSMHERGLAIDFTCNGLTIGSHSEPCWTWLEANAGTYGLRNLQSEPWHWSTN